MGSDDFGKEHATRIIVLADKDTSDAHVEEMMCRAAESFKDQVREKYNKRPPTEQEKKDIGWGNQIRSYVMQPYKLVKDLRTGEENTNIEKVLDGDLDKFIFAFLSSKNYN